MRYKFRGKRLDGQGWVVGSLWVGANNSFVIPETFGIGFDELTNRITTGGREVIPESVGQFVNRTDKWGKEVYVGDTVEGYYIDQIYGCSVSKVLIKIEQYEDVVKLDELDSFAVVSELMEVE